MKSLFTTLLTVLVFTLGSAIAQQNTLTLLDKSTMKIDGTSNLHDWTANAKTINTNMSFSVEELEAESPQNPVESLSLTIPVEQLESGKGGMNRRMYNALKKDNHPNITFELSSTTLEHVNPDSSSFTLNTSGMLTIAGVSKEVSFTVEGSIQDDGSYNFSGAHKINMTEYNVEPPSAMLGAIKCGEIVTVKFDLFFK